MPTKPPASGSHFKTVFWGVFSLTVLSGFAAIFLVLAAPNNAAAADLAKVFGGGSLTGMGAVFGLLGGKAIK